MEYRRYAKTARLLRTSLMSSSILRHSVYLSIWREGKTHTPTKFIPKKIEGEASQITSEYNRESIEICQYAREKKG